LAIAAFVPAITMEPTTTSPPYKVLNDTFFQSRVSFSFVNVNSRYFQIIILGSSSVARRKILSEMGYQFTLMVFF
jgi:hypothetical protein